MQIELESSLQRWVEAQILDDGEADRIRQWEKARMPERRARWPVLAALTFGGILLMAGMLLFVSAHWDDLSPAERMTLVVAMVGAFHMAGALFAERFRALAITLHACGTVALGAAIALAGQIFHMQEHWPAAILLWGAGAMAGWLLLRDWPQLALAAVLLPWWLVGEWTEAVKDLHVPHEISAAFVLHSVITYLSLRTGRDNAVKVALAWIGGVTLLPAAIITAITGPDFTRWHPVAFSTPVVLGWFGAILIPLAVAFVFRGSAARVNAIAAVWVIGLGSFSLAQMDTMIYAWCALGAAGMVAWGIYESRAERINLGMAGFALTIAIFFFSSVMDKLGRSASLMTLGTLCVAGGWYGEKLRRRLVARVDTGGVA